ncbi:MAG: PLP-dependent aminotransferase family protein [Pseudomonadota bacterium]
MSASLPELREIARAKGLVMHHLGAGYPHPEVTDPRGFLAHEAAYLSWRAQGEGDNDPDALPEILRESYAYTDTLGPRSVRETFAHVYGLDWGVALDPDRLIPTVGATGGISLICALFERPGEKLAYITDAPTYAGFLARGELGANSRIFSVELDGDGPDPKAFRARVEQARAAGYFVPFYYTVPDGHNPAGISFSQTRREELLDAARELGVLIVEDAPYIYIDFNEARPQPFLALDSRQTVHLFTGSKIGLPGPRVGFVYSDAEIEIAGGERVLLADLLLVESSADILFQNPAALYGFEALLHEEHDGGFRRRDTLFDVAREKLAVYRENREIILGELAAGLGDWPERFEWTIPQAGFFTVFRFLDDEVRTDDAFVARLVTEHGVVVIPMYDFYPDDARQRDARAGLNELRLSFCFSESTGAERRADLRAAVRAFCAAVRSLSGLPAA